MTRDEIMDRVWDHYNHAVMHYGRDNVLGVFLYGSQNYNCDLEDSDVDTKCILIPDLYRLACAPYSTTHLHISVEGKEEPEICECMTIQHMVANWKKQNPNFLEIMFTEYAAINPAYYDVWANFLIRDGFRESIARYDVRGGIKSIGHQALHTLEQGFTNGKKVGNAIRLLDLLIQYAKGANYRACLQCSEYQWVRKLKATPELENEELGRFIYRQLEALLEKAEEYAGPMRFLDVPMDNFIMDLIRVRLAMDE